jgi:hypothetical protein
MEHFERGGGGHDGGKVDGRSVACDIERIPGGHGLPAPVAEKRPKALAAGEEAARVVDERLELGCDREQLRRAVGEEVIESNLDLVN